MSSLPTIDDCVHCGLCLGACPTYAITGREVESPRGRIAALRNLDETGVTSPAVHEGLDHCLVCRACESVCPAGISMEGLMSHHRSRDRQRAGGGWRGAIERFFLREVLPDPMRLRAALAIAGVIAPIARTLHLPIEAPGAHRTKHALRRRRSWPRLVPTSKARGRVALFVGCITEAWCHPEHEAAVRSLVRNGWEVVPVAGQCCGALARHAGELELADRAVDASHRALRQRDVEAIISDTAGCAAALAEAESHARIPVLDTLGFLDRVGFDAPTPLDERWGVAPPCHHRHSALSERGVQRVLDTILVDGYRELPGPDHCCGAAGLYVLRQPELSAEIGHAARDRFDPGDFIGVTTANAGCLLRWESLLGPARATHPVTLLDRAYSES